MTSGTVILRTIAALVGLGLVVLAFNLHAVGSDHAATFVLLLDGLLIICGVVFEKQRYRPKIDTRSGAWTHTGEKFKDPTTGKLMEVLFNPTTGERDYKEI
jgi:hypothetical protein